MSGYVPVKGDRVRVVLEGEVSHIYRPDGGFAIGGHYVSTANPEGLVSVEKLPDPLPTTPGSVILFKGERHPWMLNTARRWVSAAKTDTTVEWLSGYAARHPFDVLRDAGAVR